MNWIDLVIIGTVGLLALLGLRSGILVPASGVGGLIVGIALALQYHSQLAAGLEEHIAGPVARAAAAFIAIVLGTTVASRLTASLVRKLLSYLVLGWLDHVAGAAAGAAIAVVLLGTVASSLTSVDIAPLSQPLRGSSLVTPISKASLLSVSDQVCAELMRAAPYVGTGTREDSPGPESVAASSDECADLKSLLLYKVSSLLGDDGETLGQLVKAGLPANPSSLWTRRGTANSRPPRLETLSSASSGHLHGCTVFTDPCIRRRRWVAASNHSDGVAVQPPG